MRKRKAILVAAGVLVALLVLREAGAFEFNVTTSESSSSYQSEHWNDAQFPKAQVTSTRVVFEEQEPASPDSVQAASPAGQSNIVVRVAPYEIEGRSWLPLYKTGSCSYSAKVQRDGQDWGKLEGTIELCVKGSAPARIVRESLREEIQKHATKTVQSWLKP